MQVSPIMSATSLFYHRKEKRKTKPVAEHRDTRDLSPDAPRFVIYA